MTTTFKPSSQYDITTKGQGEGVIGICPKCSHTKVGVEIIRRDYNAGFCRCRNCRQVFLIEGLGTNTISTFKDEFEIDTTPNPKSEFFTYIQKLPQDIQEDFRQAVTCLETNCYDASITMSRRTLQHIARETIQRLKLTPKDKTLQKELECLRDNQIIFPKTFSMYEQIKKTGNYGAHPDEIDLNKHVTQEEAENALMVIILMVKEIYENDELYNKIMPQKP